MMNPGARKFSTLAAGAALGAMLGALCGIVEWALFPGAVFARLPFAVGADGLLGFVAGLGLAGVVRIAGGATRPAAATLGILAGLLTAVPLAIALGMLANRIVLRGASFLDVRSLLLDFVALLVAAVAGAAVGRAIARAFRDRAIPAILRPASAITMALVLGAGALSPRFLVTKRPPRSDAPPIVILSIDTLRPDRLSGGGSPLPTSPEVDRLLREGSFFVDATTPSPGSAPSHASLLTSRYPVSHGVFTNFTVLSEEVETLAEVLSERGYRTAGFVTNTFLGKRFGFDQGFELYVESGRVERARSASPAVLTRSLALVQVIDRVLGRLRPGYDPSFETMLRFLDEGAEPLFLFVHVMDVHSPYAPPHPFGPRFGARPEGAPDDVAAAPRARKRNRFGWRPSEEAYVAEIRFADEKVGRLRRALQERGLLDRAILVLSSDHGENLLDHEPRFSHGRTLYDSTLRILLGIRGAGVRPGVLVAGPIENVDVLPALARITGETPRDVWEGRDPGERPQGSVAARTASFAQLQRDFAIRTPQEKIVLPENGPASRFDLLADPGESAPLPLSPEEAQRAHDRLQEWLSRHATPLYTNAPRAIRPEELSSETVEKLRALGYVD